jgi:hypothetical protein
MAKKSIFVFPMADDRQILATGAVLRPAEAGKIRLEEANSND